MARRLLTILFCTLLVLLSGAGLADDGKKEANEPKVKLGMLTGCIESMKVKNPLSAMLAGDAEKVSAEYCNCATEQFARQLSEEDYQAAFSQSGVPLMQVPGVTIKLRLAGQSCMVGILQAHRDEAVAVCMESAAQAFASSDHKKPEKPVIQAYCGCATDSYIARLAKARDMNQSVDIKEETQQSIQACLSKLQ